MALALASSAGDPAALAAATSSQRPKVTGLPASGLREGGGDGKTGGGMVSRVEHDAAMEAMEGRLNAKLDQITSLLAVALRLQ